MPGVRFPDEERERMYIFIDSALIVQRLEYVVANDVVRVRFPVSADIR